jgi:hypothetical protein
MKKIGPIGLIGPILALALLAAPGESRAAGNDKVFGLGVVFPEPTGLTGKLFLSERLAFQFDAAFMLFNRQALVGFVDFVWHPAVVTENRWFLLLWYFGVGVGTGIDAPWHESGKGKDKGWEPNPAFWVRAPFGFSFLFDKVPVEAFVQFGPASRFYPFWDWDIFGAVGGRWYFG